MAAAGELRDFGVLVEPIEADLSTTEGVDQLCAAVKGRRVDALLANAGVEHPSRKSLRRAGTNLMSSSARRYSAAMGSPDNVQLVPSNVAMRSALNGA